MMGHQQFHTLADRFSGDRRRDREAGHHPLDWLQPVADKQAHVVPLRR
jgi:hypothetical protein